MLIIDDDLGFVFRLGDVLAAVGYKPVPARKLSEAIERIRTFVSGQS
jgi:ActR/RegA family two-component response regulator